MRRILYACLILVGSVLLAIVDAFHFSKKPMAGFTGTIVARIIRSC